MKTRFFPVFSICLLLAVGSAHLLAQSALEPAPRLDDSWKRRQELLNQRATEAAGKAQVIFIGDSITQGWEGAGKEVWAKYYTPRHAVNLGIGGDRTQHVLWRLDNGNLNGLKPKAAVVMIGTNNSNGEDSTVEQIADGVTSIVKKLREKLPDTKVALLAIFPRGENPNSQRGKLLQINQILQKLGDNKHIFYVDFGHNFITAKGLIPTSLMPDYLHLSPEGYGIWAESIEELLGQLLGDAPAKAVTASNSLTGEWTLTVQGPDGTPVSLLMVLKQDGSTVNGRIAHEPDRWLEIENGKVSGSGFSWSVNRERSDGARVTYEMSGKVEGNTLTGRVKTSADGDLVDVEWSAKRN